MNLNNMSPADLAPMAENPGKLKHGILPSTEMMAAQGFLMGRQAYKHAKRAAEQGFDPDTAAKYGASVAWFQVQFWFQATIMGVVALFAIGLSNVSAVFPIWAIGQLGFIAFFALRLNKVMNTPPNKVLRYPFWRRTSTVYAAAWLWPVLVFVIAATVWVIASPMVAGHVPVDPNSLGSGPGTPTVQTAPVVPTTVPVQPVYTPPPTTTPAVPAYDPEHPVPNIGNGLSPGCTGDQWTGMVCH